MESKRSESLQEESSAIVEAAGTLSFLLFYRTTCPNCPPVRRRLEESGLSGREINVDTDEGLAEAKQYGVMAAPTAVIFDETQQEVHRAYNKEELDRFFDTRSAAESRDPQELLSLG